MVGVRGERLGGLCGVTCNGCKRCTAPKSPLYELGSLLSHMSAAVQPEEGVLMHRQKRPGKRKPRSVSVFFPEAVLSDAQLVTAYASPAVLNPNLRRAVRRLEKKQRPLSPLCVLSLSHFLSLSLSPSLSLFLSFSFSFPLPLFPLAMAPSRRLSVIVPTYNETDNIRPLATRLFKVSQRAVGSAGLAASVPQAEAGQRGEQFMLACRVCVCVCVCVCNRSRKIRGMPLSATSK